MTLDYEEDLLFFKEVLKVNKNNETLNLDRIIEICDQNPYIKKINFFRQEDFLNNQIKCGRTIINDTKTEKK